MGLGDEYALNAVDAEPGRQAAYDEETDPVEPETQLEKDRQALHDYLEETEDDEIEVPDRLKPLIGPVGAAKTHRPKKRGTRQHKKRLQDSDENPELFGHYHRPSL